MLSRQLGTETRLHWKCSLVSCISGVPCSSTGLWGHWILPGVSLLWWHGAESWQLPALLCSALPAPAHPMLAWGQLGMVFLPPHHLPATAHSQAEPANCATTPADRGSAFPLLFLHVHPAEMQAQGAAHTARVKPGAGSWCSHPFPGPSSAPPCSKEEPGAAHAGNQGVCMAPNLPHKPRGPLPPAPGAARAAGLGTGPASHPAPSQRVLMPAGCPRLLPARSRARKSRAPPQNHP